MLHDAPAIGQVGRVGWQNWQMQTLGWTRPEAVAAFKPWKNDALSRLRAVSASATAGAGLSSAVLDADITGTVEPENPQEKAEVGC